MGEEVEGGIGVVGVGGIKSSDALKGTVTEGISAWWLGLDGLGSGALGVALLGSERGKLARLLDSRSPILPNIDDVLTGWEMTGWATFDCNSISGGVSFPSTTASGFPAA